MFFSVFKDECVVIAYDTVVHQIFDRILTVYQRLASIFTFNDEEGLVDGRGVNCCVLRIRLLRFQRLHQWVNDRVAFGVKLARYAFIQCLLSLSTVRLITILVLQVLVEPYLGLLLKVGVLWSPAAVFCLAEIVQ